mmetsp:Transcript_31629/g.98413  ORF Transcript_31629/g.98413 Transcript_31629/m.98413 type:complete len:311 (-) Transcript_31629:30-962(-)
MLTNDTELSLEGSPQLMFMTFGTTMTSYRALSMDSEMRVLTIVNSVMLPGVLNLSMICGEFRNIICMAEKTGSSLSKGLNLSERTPLIWRCSMPMCAIGCTSKMSVSVAHSRQMSSCTSKPSWLREQAVSGPNFGNASPRENLERLMFDRAVGKDSWRFGTSLLRTSFSRPLWKEGQMRSETQVSHPRGQGTELSLLEVSRTSPLSPSPPPERRSKRWSTSNSTKSFSAAEWLRKLGAFAALSKWKRSKTTVTMFFGLRRLGMSFDSSSSKKFVWSQQQNIMPPSNRFAGLSCTRRGAQRQRQRHIPATR